MRRLLVVTSFILGLATPASADWIRVDSPNFTVFGELGEKRTREYAAEFERFREALGRVVPGASLRAAVPTVVFVFRDQRTFGPYRPLYNGKPIELGGYFSGGESLNVIMLAATDRESALRLIFHEYSHLVVSNIARGLPPWLNEGLAEYYSTFEVSPDGRRAVLGKLIDSHLARLRSERMLPIEELLAVQRDSPLYNEGSRRSTFYAQSWALVHMLLNGEPRRDNEVDQYVRLVAGGRSPLEAWREVFRDPKMLDHLRRYVTQFSMRGFVFTFDRDIQPATFAVTKPPEADVMAALGDLRRQVSPETVPEHMGKITGGPSPYVQAVRGLVNLDANKPGEALPLLTAAARSTDDWLVLYRAATGLERLARDDDSRETVDAALTALNRALEKKPDLPHAIAMKALLLGSGDEGLATIQKARELAPGREHYAVWQAQFHLERGEYAAARGLLGPLMTTWYPQHIRDYARSVMGQAVAREQAEARQEEQRKMLADQRARTGDPAPPPGGDRPARAGEVQWVYRELQRDEQRIEGLLERLECPRSGVVLHVRQDGSSRRFTAAAFEKIEFISYRDDLSGAINCGARTPPDRVYVTFVADPAKTSDGRVIAVEFLPPSGRESSR